MNLLVFGFIVMEGIAAVLALIVLLLSAALAYIVFRVLKKSMKMAFRLILVAVILFVGLVGSGIFWWMSSGDNKPARQTAPANIKRR